MEGGNSLDRNRLAGKISYIVVFIYLLKVILLALKHGGKPREALKELDPDREDYFFPETSISTLVPKIVCSQ